jgi:hypothetical protein
MFPDFAALQACAKSVRIFTTLMVGTDAMVEPRLASSGEIAA